MTSPSDRFVFENTCDKPDSQNALVVHVPAGIKTKRRLLAVLAKGLSFPDYFGWNWDALDECLGDLSWIQQNRVIVLSHQDLPFAIGSANRSTYISILASAVETSSTLGQHGLQVTFPNRCQPEIKALLDEQHP